MQNNVNDQIKETSLIKNVLQKRFIRMATWCSVYLFALFIHTIIYEENYFTHT